MGSRAESKLTWSEILKGLVVLGIVVLLILAALRGLFVFVFPAVVRFFSDLGSLDAGVLVALITGTISIIVVLAKSVIDSRTQRKEYLKKNREKPYMRLISILYDFQLRTKTGEEMAPDELLVVMNEFNKELTLWGSSKAIKVWGAWRVSSAREAAQPSQILFEMEEVLLQLRKDMGLGRGLKRGDLLRLTVNDIDELVA